MSRLEELIAELCPDGVEYRRLDECCDILDNQRKPVTKKDRLPGPYPYYGANGIQDYVHDYIFDGTFLLMGEDGSVINKDNSPVVTWACGKIWVNNHAHILKEKEEVSLRYLYHYLQTVDISSVVRGVPPKLNQQNLRDITIPLPPLEVQREIVRILDAYSERVAELTDRLAAELDARKKQYEYYRDDLLIFEDDIHWKTIGELTHVFSAARVHRNEWTTEGVPFFRSSDVVSISKGIENPRGKAYISLELYEKLSAKSGKISKGDILITGGGSIGIPYIVPTDDPLYVKDADLICIQKTPLVNTRFLYHYFNSTMFRNYLMGITHDATIAHYTISQIQKTPIPLPPLAEQERIVAILDRFDKLCNDISEGLPAEIEARRKQYEHYRDQLLTFKKKTA